MDIKELRIGNYINLGGLSRIDNVCVTAVMTNKVYYCMMKTVVFDDRFYSLNYYVEPIRLTDEWLIKFGFSKSAIPNCEDIYKDLTARMVLWFNEGNYAEMDLIQDDKRISFKHSHIKYVHQLQNLYYALTGLELTIGGQAGN